MSSFFANVTDTGVSVPDEKTLKFNHFGGQITLQFQSTANLMAVVDAIIDATKPPAPSVAVPTTPSEDVPTAADDLEFGALTVADTDASGASDSGSETEYEAPSEPDECESSFESYNGGGMTQSAIF